MIENDLIKRLNNALTSSYDIKGFTVQEILSNFHNKIIEIIEQVNKNEENCLQALNFIELIKNELLLPEVRKALQELVDNGTIEQLINVNKFNELEEKFNEEKIKNEEKFNEVKINIEEIKAEKESRFINVKYPPENLAAAMGDDDGNGNGTDDTLALQAIFDYAFERGLDIIFPVGKYKVTAPIVIQERKVGSTYKRLKHSSIYGTGYSSFDLVDESCTICGYNIPNERAVIELLGESNGASVHGRIENIAIHCDNPSNGEMSFCLFVGDCWFFKAEKVKLVGKNCLKTRCGSAETNNTATYAVIATKFEQCQFETVGNKGWALYPEYLSQNNTNSYGYDNLYFDTCTFRGVTFVYAFTCQFNNCMWWVKPNKDKVSYSTSPLRGFTVDFSTAIWLAMGNSVSINNCYFEDYSKAILIQPIGGSSVKNVFIEKSLFNSWSNFTDLDNPNTNYKAEVAICVKPNSLSATNGFIDKVVIKNNTFNDDATGRDGSGIFTDTVIRNEYANCLIVEDNTVGKSGGISSKELRIVDTFSKQFSISDTSNFIPNKTKTVEFNCTVNGANNICKILNSEINNYPLIDRGWIQRITIITDKVLSSTDINFVLLRNGSSLEYVDITNSNNIDISYTENNNTIYVMEKKIHHQSTRSKVFDVNEKLGCKFYIGGIVAADNGTNIKVLIDIAY